MSALELQQEQLKARQEELERALAVADTQESHAAHVADAVEWHQAGQPAKVAHQSKVRSADRTHLLRRYFDAMSDHPDYHERRRQRLSAVQPFSFHERELTRAKSGHTQRVEEETLRREEACERELRSKFKANPVPPTTFVPKYDMMVDEWCARKEALRLVAEKRAEERRIAEQPGKDFAAAMEATKPKKAKNPEEAHREWKAKHCKPFRAKPVPKFVHQPRLEHRDLIEQQRRERIQARAKDLLALSKAPPRLQNKTERATDAVAARSAAGTTRPQSADAGACLRQQNKEFTFAPKVTPDVPPYEEQWAKESLRLKLRREQRPPTNPKEFAGLRRHADRTASTTQSKVVRRAASASLDVPRAASPIVAAVLLDMARDEATLKEQRWPYKSSRTRVPPSDFRSARASSAASRPPIATRAHSCRAEAAYKKIVAEDEARREEENTERKRAQRHRAASQRMSAILSQLGLNGDTTEDRIARKARENRQALAGQSKQYWQQLKETQQRLQSELPRYLSEASVSDKLDRDATARAGRESEAVRLLKKHGLGEKSLRDTMQAFHTAQLDGVTPDVVAVEDAAPKNHHSSPRDAATDPTPSILAQTTVTTQEGPGASTVGATSAGGSGAPPHPQSKSSSSSSSGYSSDSSFASSSSASSKKSTRPSSPAS